MGPKPGAKSSPTLEESEVVRWSTAKPLTQTAKGGKLVRGLVCYANLTLWRQERWHWGTPKRYVAAEIIRRMMAFDLPAFIDDELVLSAEELFPEPDRREVADKQP
jgi:hypothetical protein